MAMADVTDHSFTENYHGFTVEGQREFPTGGDYDRWFFRVSCRGVPQFRRSVRISRSQATTMRLDDSQVNTMLKDTGARQIHGKIDLDRYVKDENEEYLITGDAPEASKLDNQDIRLYILHVLEKVRGLDPTRHMLASFDTEGFCEVLGIRHADYMSNAAYLREIGCVADSRIQQLTIERGGIYITAAGIDYREQQRQRLDREATMSVDAEAIRDRILEVLYAHEETGDSHYLPSTAIAEQLNLSDRITRHHLDVLYSDGYIKLSRTFTELSAILDTHGRQRVLEGYRHAPVAHISGGTSISISNSTVGMLNTGQVASVNSISVNISQLTNDGHTEVAEALKHITEFVAQNQEMASQQREELLDLLADLSEQAALQPQQRMKTSSLRAIVNGVVTGLSVAGSSAEIWSTWGPAIMMFFGIA